MRVPLPIACLQTRPVPTMAAAITEAIPMAEEAVGQGAQILFLPEYCGGLVSDGPALRPPAETEKDHPVLAALRETAANTKTWIMVGSIAVIEGDSLLNRGYMLSPTGAITGRYDKIHLFDIDLEDASYRESDTITPGETAVIHDTEHARIAHTICYDLRFPQLYRTLAQAGADILTCPAAFTQKTGKAHWHILIRARAIENTRPMVAPCAIGPIEGGGATYGHSLIVDPWGKILADAGTKPGPLYATLEPNHPAPQNIPSLKHDRPYTPPSRPEQAA